MKLRRRESGLETALTDGMVIGRAPDCQLVVPESSVSRKHARIEQRGLNWWLVDLKSSNGIACNGQKLESFELRGGDLVTLGSVAYDVIVPVSSVNDLGLDLEEPTDFPSASLASTPTLAPAQQVSASAQGDSNVTAAPSRADLERARLRREAEGTKRSRGLGDLSQQPTWVIVLLALVGGGVIWGVAMGMRLLMATISPTG
ncbi:MAG: FHA domain-containing protein [Planctomycetes bacterium]|nr:FHA domain-containing protein [Planctomycetota bacterium]